MTWFPWELRVASDRTTILLPRNYSAQRIEEVIRQYKVTHVLWGSFEPPPHVDPETWGPYLDQVRTAAGADIEHASSTVRPASCSTRCGSIGSHETEGEAGRPISRRDQRPMRWSLVILAAILVFDVWYRAHTFGPTVAAGDRAQPLADDRRGRRSRSTATRRPMPTSAIACSTAT